MPTINELKNARVQKLEAIQRAGVLAYPENTKRTHAIIDVLKDFNRLAKSKKEVILAGRVKAVRGHGGSAFLDIEDGTGKIQAIMKEDRLGKKGYKFCLGTLDIGDFFEVRGILFVTKRGEKTIEVADCKMLAKSLLPLPEKWHGIQDIEERFRKRYLDLIFNRDIKEKFVLRSQIVKEIRNFLESRGFLEVETPILQPIYGGANAKPFKTHLNAFNMDLYLRISPELYLKRLLVGGFEKIYEIGKCFRNEGSDRSHNPDFTELEFYWAYADYKDLMKLTEELFKEVLKKVFNKTKIKYEELEINFKTPWPRMEFSQLLRKYAKIDIEGINLEALKKEAGKLEVKIEESWLKPEIADAIYKKYCLPKIIDPVFIINHPVGTKPLAKQSEKNPKVLSNFQLVAAGWELANAFSELNDPIEQRKRFEEQERSFRAGLSEAQRMDIDFIEALEHGMPPAAGFGMGIDRLVALLTGAHSLRDAILFPTMRPKQN